MFENLTSKLLGLIPALPIWYLSAKLFLANWPYLGAVVGFAGFGAWAYVFLFMLVAYDIPREEARKIREAEIAAAGKS